MNLPLAWQQILKAREPDLAVLVTVNPYGADPTGGCPHLADQPGSVRLALDTVHVPSRGRTLPFWGWLSDWPLLEERYAPHDRRAEISETTITAQGGAGLAQILLDAGGGQRATARIDLWSPRLDDLRDALPMIAGPVRGVPQLADRAGPVSLTITDGDPDRSTEYPPGVIDTAEFPAAPDHVRGSAQRQVVIGGYPYQIPCPQIDGEGLQYYVHEGWAASDPTQFFSYGSPTAAPLVERRRTAASESPFTALRFSERPAAPEGLLSAVSCAGGVGLLERSPALFLLEQIGGYRLTARARQLLEQSPFVFDLLLNARGDVRRIVAEQLVPQTDLVLTFRQGQVDAFSVRNRAGVMRLGIGAGLLWRHARQDEQSPISSVFNDIEVRCGRNVTTGGSLVKVRRSPDHGSAEIRASLVRSARAYGRRAVTWEAFDLAVQQHADGTLSCPAGELLADVLADAHALPLRPHAYRASWLEGMSLAVGQRAEISDAAERLDRTPCVVTRRAVLPTGVDLAFATPLDPAAAFAAQRTVFDA